MKRVLSLVLVACVAFSLGHFLRAPIPLAGAAGGGAATPSGNGDVNGDGEFDISDPVYLAVWLFQHGAPPVAIECPPARLPATGQTTCFDNEGAEIPCDSLGFPGQDGAHQAGCPTNGRFDDHGDGTVTDTCTGLMWQKDTAAIGEGDGVNWLDALKYCDGLSFAGYDDWRLPNVRELESIVDYGRRDPAIDPVFGETASYYYWSSTSFTHMGVSGPFYGHLGVHFGNGSVNNNVLVGGELYSVRAVRGGL